MGLGGGAARALPARGADGDDFRRADHALQAAEIFTAASDETLARLTAIARREEHAAGSALYDIGDPADDLYVLESGRVEFLIGRDERTTSAGFMLRKRRGVRLGRAARESAAAASPVRPAWRNQSLLRMSGKETLKVLEADPASGFIVMRKLSSLVTRYLTLSGAK